MTRGKWLVILTLFSVDLRPLFRPRYVQTGVKEGKSELGVPEPSNASPLSPLEAHSPVIVNTEGAQALPVDTLSLGRPFSKMEFGY